jgi:hypothetical protein
MTNKKPPGMSSGTSIRGKVPKDSFFGVSDIWTLLICHLRTLSYKFNTKEAH